MDIIDVHEGCPPERFEDLLLRLAKMHAICWVLNDATSDETASSSTAAELTPISSILKDNAHKLSSTPGVGHSLPPYVRQQQFQSGWPGVRERLLPYFQSDDGMKSLHRLDEIVSWTAQSPRIEGLAMSVAERKQTLVHGDYHVGNMLLPKACEQDQTPWLVDWSMAGIGNSCVDLVFFLVVGADAIQIYETAPF